MVEPVRHRRTKGAETDMFEPKATASHLDSTRLIPNARLETIDDGHLFMVTRPDETAAIIEAFLAE